MAKDCCGGTVETLVVSGAGIKVTGSGTQVNPYVVTNDLPDFSRTITVRDSDTVNMRVWGEGTIESPFIISADSSMSLSKLTDIEDPQGGPIAGEVPVFVGSGETGHWEFRLPPANPAGAVNVGAGLGGVGSALSPIYVKLSGAWGAGALAGLGVDSTIGLPVYADSTGALRAWQAVSSAIAWDSIKDKPTLFAPAAHKHPASDITDQQSLNAGKVNGIKIFSGSTAPTAPSVGDLWFY